MNVNAPVLSGYSKIASKFNLQDISFRAMSGRIKKLTGIAITPTELMISMSDDAEELDRKAQAKLNKYYKWVYKQAGEYIVNDLDSAARPHIMWMLQLYLLGFATKETMIKKVKVTKAMAKEGGGIAIPDWRFVINSIEEHQSRKGKRKG